MNDIKLNYEQFLEFDQFDQFGFFYDEDGFEKENADEEFEDDVKELFHKFDSIIVTSNDSIYGVKSGKKELLMEFADDAFLIANEVTDKK